MKGVKKIKQKLVSFCLEFVNKKQATFNVIIESNKKALHSETKSSAGDKHETGRAMIQLEMEKASQQLIAIQEMKKTIQKLATTHVSTIVRLGSLVKTENATYFLAISAGKISIDSIDYFVVSTKSPIGQQLLGKKVGDYIPFNATTILEVN